MVFDNASFMRSMKRGVLLSRSHAFGIPVLVRDGRVVPPELDRVTDASIEKGSVVAVGEFSPGCEVVRESPAGTIHPTILQQSGLIISGAHDIADTRDENID